VISGVTCGRPSGRTVETQDTGASFRISSPSAHSIAPAPTVLYRGSTFAVGSMLASSLVSWYRNGRAARAVPKGRNRLHDTFLPGDGRAASKA